MPANLHNIKLEPDCANCAAYCCVALAFDKSTMFAYDKQAAEPCKHLDAKHECTIHDDLKTKGFRGCVRYNCFGAGQRVFNELFDRRSWRDHPEQAQDIFDAYRVMHNVHEFLAMLQAAKKLTLDEAQLRQVSVFEAELTPAAPWSVATLTAFQTSGTFEEIRNFFKSLGDKV
ncbi:hypothetical protein [Maritalea porphyrae]|uniref:Pentapeptide repeat-containing protein n=1 Tax=Maritalea porphyrae TaxID=880732 RepID=A0ABQ5UQX8_9HYPH|nr:hypothetical protein [Maritalea porphyrae]GLQ17670.1 hypothetical protein GCM10007879_19190 [Maritalea porphyrae]